MKIKNLLLLMAAASTIVSCKNMTSKVSVETHLDSISYIMGASDGQSLSTNFEKEKLDTLIDIDLYFKALEAATKEKELKYDVEANKTLVQNFFKEYYTNKMQAAKDSTFVNTFKPSASTIDSVSYIMGALDGKSIIDGFKKDGLDTVISFPVYLQAFFATGKGAEAIIPVEENINMVKEFFTKLQEDRLLVDFADVKKAGEEYLALNKANENVTVTASGLQYEILKEGNGPKPSISDRVKVNYHGTLIDGTVFDSSLDRGEPVVFGVGQVIPGWTEALQLMPVGSKWKISIPYDLAYGTRPNPNGPIKPFAALIFEVELLEIVSN